MPAVPPQYEFTATTAQEATTLLDAAEKLLQAHLMMLAPDDNMVRIELRKRTRVAMKITLDLGNIVRTISEVETLNEQMQSPATDPAE
jgi:hypothetical protein